MRKPSRSGLAVAGLLTWAVAIAPTAARIAAGETADVPPRALWAVAAVGFALGFLVATAVGARRTRTRVVAIALQTVAASILVAVDRAGIPGALLAVTAGQLPFFVRVGPATAWLGLQVAMPAALAVLPVPGAPDLLGAAAYGGLQIFAFAAALLARREAAARAELALTHAELLAAHALLAESSRSAERIRIARELHDSLGHHLSALSIHLELARQLAHGAAAEPVARSHALARQLLGEVREVVSAMRDDRRLDLAGSLRSLVAGIPVPAVHLSVGEDLGPIDPAVAHAIFRCVQEALTNAVRHARADAIWIDLAADEAGRLELVIRDDGIGAERVEPGLGLTGVRERVEALGGRLAIDGGPEGGLRLYARVPDRAPEAA